MVSTPSSHSSWTWVQFDQVRVGAMLAGDLDETDRVEELVEPITRTRSHSRASSLTAIWRLVVA